MSRQKSLKKGINVKFYMVCVISIILTLILTVLVLFNVFRKQVFQDLETYTHFLYGTDYMDRLTNEREYYQQSSQRITVVNQSGQVIYDNHVDIDTMDNHKDRVEIATAFQEGSGSTVRLSETASRSTYYYAKLMPDQNVLRISIDSHNAFAFFRDMVPYTILIAVFIFVICFVVTSYLTKRILRPIHELATDMSEIEGKEIYEELIPFFRIIHEQRENINQKMNEIERSSIMRQEFTANVSHELKTPITIITGYAELIESGMVEETDVKRFAGEIKCSADRLLVLINDIIQLSELDMNQVELVKEEFNLSTLIFQCVAMLQVKASGLHVNIDAKGNQNCMVYANKMMIEEMINNLCDNAIRYNKKGGEVNVLIKENGFIVKDTGIGIPKEHIGRVFERFYRVDKSRSKATGGTGLGLAIVKHIAENNGAEIELKSIEGEGSVVEVTFDSETTK